ncbi:hypothetical protein KP509_13G076400 [Ceratopteris richardii]|nr:hypothetical protein KP509_13G076400 [Ceratopteris richardii]
MGMAVHHQLIRSNHDADSFLCNLLVQMYGKCGALDEANCVLARIPQRDVFTWTFIISAYSRASKGCDSQQLFSQMLHEAVLPSSFTLVEFLCACGKHNLLVEGKRLHSTIMVAPEIPEIVLENALLNFYGKSSDLGSAMAVFYRMEGRDVVSWNTMLTAYNQHEDEYGCWQFFQIMLQHGVLPNKVTYTCLCDACISKQGFTSSRRCHSYIIGSGFMEDVDVVNTLICMYIRCGVFNDALLIFHGLSELNVVTWTTLITGYVQQGIYKKAIGLVQQMLIEGVLPNHVTYLSLISACSSDGNSKIGMCTHARLKSMGIELNLSIGNALINLYGKCGQMKRARILFDDMPMHDEVSWNSLIAAYSLQEQHKEVLDIFIEMGQARGKWDRITIITILQSCASELDLDAGRLLHYCIYQCSIVLDTAIASALVAMYVKCGTLEDAKAVFDKVVNHTVVLWTALISAYGQHGQNYQTTQMFDQMKLEGIIPDHLVISTVLLSFTGKLQLLEGKRIEAAFLGNSVRSEPVFNNSLLFMYSKCGTLKEAEHTFKKLTSRNVVAWNIIITAFVQRGQPKQAFSFFSNMLADGVAPNMSIYSSLLNACAALTALAEGKWIHEMLLRSGITPDIILGAALVNLYGKCGSIEDANRIFERLPKRNLATWNSILAAHCQKGDVECARHIFKQMQDEGIRPDGITFLTIISSLSHAGMVDEALYVFFSMDQDYGVAPTVKHYNCLIDLFGRAGCLEKVEHMFSLESYTPDMKSWMTVLSACKVHEDVERGEHIVKNLSDMEINDEASKVLMSNIYAAAGRFDSATLMRD